MKTEIEIKNPVNSNPLWYFYNVYSGNWCQNQESAFNELIIFFQNRVTIRKEKFTCEKEYIKAFYEPNQTSIKHIYFYWSDQKKENYRLWNKRMVFLCNTQIEILALLISTQWNNEVGRFECNIDESKAKAYVKLYEWLSQLPVMEEHEELKIHEWLQSIESTYLKSKAITESFEVLVASEGEGALNAVKQSDAPIKEMQLTDKPSSKKKSVEYFYQLFKGEDDKEKKRKFDKMISLLEKGFISNKDSNNKYEWHLSQQRGNLLLACLCRELNKNHLEIKLTSMNCKELLGQWIDLSKGRLDSISKNLQPKIQRELDDYNHDDFINLKNVVKEIL